MGSGVGLVVGCLVVGSNVIGDGVGLGVGFLVVGDGVGFGVALGTSSFVGNGVNGVSTDVGAELVRLSVVDGNPVGKGLGFTVDGRNVGCIVGFSLTAGLG